jgi:hypothetical protein
MVTNVLKPYDGESPSIGVSSQVNSDAAHDLDDMVWEDDTGPRSPYAYSLVVPSISRTQWLDVGDVRFGTCEGSLNSSISELYYSFKGCMDVLDYDTETGMWVCRLCGVLSGNTVILNEYPAKCAWMDYRVLLEHGRSSYHAEAMRNMNNMFIVDPRMFASAPWFNCRPATFYRVYMGIPNAAKRQCHRAPVPPRDDVISRVQLLNAYSGSAHMSSSCSQDILG